MIARLVSPLPVLAVSLLLLLAAEWRFPGSAAPGLQPAPEIPATLADNATDAGSAQWTDIILARPILSQTRRPPPATGMAPVSDTLPRLSAIIVIGGTRRAIFAESGQRPQMVAEGGEIGAYRISTVAPDRVDLLGPNGLLTLKPQYVSAPPAP